MRPTRCHPSTETAYRHHRRGGGDHLAIPTESAAGVQVHDDFLRTLSLVHVRGRKVEFSVRVEVSYGQRVDHGLHLLFDDVLFPVAGGGGGRSLVPRDAVRAALEFRRGEDDIQPAVAVDVAEAYAKVARLATRRRRRGCRRHGCRSIGRVRFFP